MFGLRVLLIKKGDIIIPVNNEGAIHIIKAPYKNEAV